jgi:hypothetical protein
MLSQYALSDADVGDASGFPRRTRLICCSSKSGKQASITSSLFESALIAVSPGLHEVRTNRGSTALSEATDVAGISAAIAR